ncbi:MAG: MFS transporter [Planctomycetota bacterium]|nr:MFS transporter [Planctomycetota bacterium]
MGSPTDQGVVSMGGTWSPLKSRIFTVVLLTSLFTQLAVFMSGLASAWVMTDITDSPAVVASLQIAVALPMFLLALFAGALADVVSRKRIILFSLTGSMIVTGAFVLLSASESHSEASLLGLTAALGGFTALAAPAWIAVIPGLVSRSDLAGAMTLSSAGISGAGALGPAIGGILIAIAGPTWVFGLNVIVFAAAILALRVWKPAPLTGLPHEHIVSAMRLGFQYMRYDRPLKVVIGKIIPFALAAVALISLLPAVARFRLEAGPATFGLLSGAGGVGAVLALLVMPSIRRRVGPDFIVLGSMLIEAAVFVVLASTTNLGVAAGVIMVAGAATLAIVSTVMTVLQVVLPSWIRGRGVALFLLAVQGSFAVGALIWGGVAEQTSLQTALVSAGLTMAVSAVLVLPLRLSRYMDVDTDTATLLADPPTVTSVHDDDGPILLTARWQIDPAHRDDFVAAMEPVRRALKRQGALSFRLVEDVEQPGHMLESFTMATWSEYQRLPHRATMADKEIHVALVDAAGSEVPALTAHRVIKLRSGRSNHSSGSAR